MRIAQVAPLTESVPPQTYGGTERVVSYLTEALVRLGHDVTLYAAGDSVTSAELRPGCRRSLRRDPEAGEPVPIHDRMMRRLLAEADEYDIIHFHTGWFEFPLFTGAAAPCVSTLHGPLDVPLVQERLRHYRGFPLISISDAQRTPLPELNWAATIHHGLPDVLAVADWGKHDYLAFLGRICPEKRPDLAIAIARRAGWPLKIAAKVDPVDREYFASVIQPLLDPPHVEYVGELDEADKMRFLAGARALLFPIDWPEPFGLVMIEAMACGTPVIAFNRGSVPEILEDGLTGFIVEDADAATRCVAAVDGLSRPRIREVFRRRFLVQRMAADHLRVYERLAAGARKDRRAEALPPAESRAVPGTRAAW
jgi:glycosyltransferase involved in cell wall biosynthesis